MLGSELHGEGEVQVEIQTEETCTNAYIVA